MPKRSNNNKPESDRSDDNGIKLVILFNNEGDRLRVFCFAEALKDQRQGKQYQRAIRHLGLEADLEQYEVMVNF